MTTKMVHSTLIAVGLLTVLTQFQNCDIYSDNSLFTAFNSLCEGEECSIEDSNFLEVRINSDGDIPVYPGVGSVDIGGDCNEGGFQSNFIRWSLYDDRGFVQGSDQYLLPEGETDSICPLGHTSCCFNGQWQATVFLNEPRVDGAPAPILRNGLLNADGQRVPYRIEVEIFGLREGNSQAVPGPLGKRQIFLIPANFEAAPPAGG